MDSETEQTKHKIKTLLANYLGIETEDIEDDSILAEDLHMKPTDLTDFTEMLNKNGLDGSSIDLTEIETFEDLVEAITE